MSFSQNLKYILKVLIIIVFIVDRYTFYHEMKAVESDQRDLHHNIIGSVEVNYGRIESKYNNHPLFVLPATKYFVDEFKTKLESKFNLNMTVSHESHQHANDTTHSNRNKLIEIDTKFFLAFLNFYDLVILALLIYLLNSDSLTINSLLLFDSILRVISIAIEDFKELRLIFLYNSLYSFINDLVKKDYRSTWEEGRKLIIKEEVLGLNVFLFSLLLFLLFVASASRAYNTTLADSSVNQKLRITNFTQSNADLIANQQKEVKNLEEYTTSRINNFKQIDPVKLTAQKEEMKKERTKSRESTPSRRRPVKSQL